MAAQSSSLYNEERNLLRIRERERRNQEAIQERDTFVDNAPLFPEPFKTSKEDELSSRIQSMLGNYEEIKELIGAKSHQNLIGIPVTSQGRSDNQHPIHSKTSRSIGPPRSSMSLGHRSRPYTAPELSSGGLVKTHIQNHSLQNNRTQEQRSGNMSVERSGKQGQEKRSVERSCSPESILALSPLLLSLSTSVEPLSPLHSSYQIDSKPRGGQSCEKSYTRVTKSPILTDSASREGSTNVANLVPSSQTFATYLTTKIQTLPPKPTAYVRPMDGQDQATTFSPDLKPLQDDYHEEPYESQVDLKLNTKDKLSRVEMASEHFETFTNEAHCVEDILKEMTHSWPPPLTCIHTPSTAETSKFAFPNKESQHVPSVKVNQRHHDNFSKVFPSPQQGSSMLEDDLQISDSEDSDDNGEEEEEITEKPLSSSAPSSVVQSHVDSVASAHSSSRETEGSESDTTSDSESDSGSSDSEVPPPRRSPSPVHDTSSTGIWQLGNFLVKPAPLAENHNNVADHEQESHWESKEHDCHSPPQHESPKTEPQHKTSLWTSPEDIQNKPAFPGSPVANETVTPRQTVGIKHPRRPVKASFQEEPKGGLTVESEPAPYRPRDQPSKEKPTVKTKVKTKSSQYKEPNASIGQLNEKKKHRSAHHSSSTKKCPSTQTDKHQSAPSHPQSPPSPNVHIESKTKHRTNISHPAVVVREDCHRDKVLLPIGENRLLPPVKSSHKPIALLVKIELSMLSRIPGASSKISESKSKKANSHNAHHKEKSEKTHNHSKEHTKRKVEESGKNGTNKKLKLLNDAKPSTAQKESSVKKVPKTPSEEIHKVQRQPKASSPTHKKPEKVAQKRQPSESSTCSQQSTTSSSKSSKEQSTPKLRKMEEKNTAISKSNKGSTENNTNPFPVPSLPNGNAKPTRPQLKFEEKLHSPEHYMKEAKKLKHKADAMSDKIGKSLNYLDAAMFFIECGIAMEADVQAPKSAYTMFAETVDLIKFIMKLKNFSDSLAPAHEKSFAVLCMRCQSVLYMAMFRYKKDTALKYSRTLGEHFKSSSRAAQAPSPCVARSTGTPSPMSPTPSPASSGGSQPGSIASNSGGQNASVTIPQMIHHIASSYVNITSYFLYAYDIWEQADVLAKKNKDFFADLRAMVCPLALNSTMTELVHYTRQGLQWLRLELSMT
ncbi:AF4/FMR2 family member 1 isoform X2 [Rhinoderma darwinii]|uniref:AF4/FMR2 family member 1 isoform X2 n=1 Tax=Rhinoderma darwinii TaxID=43563 RepID=UPI003F680A9E